MTDHLTTILTCTGPPDWQISLVESDQEADEKGNAYHRHVLIEDATSSIGLVGSPQTLMAFANSITAAAVNGMHMISNGEVAVDDSIRTRLRSNGRHVGGPGKPS